MHHLSKRRFVAVLPFETATKLQISKTFAYQGFHVDERAGVKIFVAISFLKLLQTIPRSINGFEHL